ncbi:MAG: hypothetical protein AAB402_01130 [Patescibacteria group bacterium]
MNIPPAATPPQNPVRPSIGKASLKALGFGLLLAIPMTYVFAYGAFSFISYFRLSYNWGLAGMFIPFIILFYGFAANAIIMGLTTFITLERSRRPYLHAVLIGLIVNLLFIIGGWGYNLYAYQGRLTELKAQRNNDSYVTAKGIADCAKLTDVQYWRVCINNKVATAADKAACDTQAIKYAAQSGGATSECAQELAISSGSTALCADVPLNGNAYANQRDCLSKTIQKSWEKNDRKTPLAIVEGCAAITDPQEKQFCYVVSLRQLTKGDPAATVACQRLDPHLWFGPISTADNDLTNIKNVCGLTITPTS